MDLERLFSMASRSPATPRPVFTNRLSEVEAFQRVLARMVNDVARTTNDVLDLAAPRDNVLVYYGMGGIGKSTLSRELQRRFDEGEIPSTEHRQSFRIDLAELSSLDAELVLVRMRACLGQALGGLPAFDIAFSLYWERKHPGEPLADFLDRRSGLARLASGTHLSQQIQDGLDSVLGGVGLMGTAWRLGSLIRNGVVRRFTEARLFANCPFFDPLVNEASPESALLFLPSLLAWELAETQRRRPTTVVVFIDTWETIEKAVDERGGVEDALSRLVYLMPNVLFVITGRSQVTWSDELRRASLKYAGVRCWPSLDDSAADRQQVLVGNLSPRDCDRYLCERLRIGDRPAIPPQVRQRIVEGSQGLPLYLDLSVELYDELLGRGETPTPDAFGTTLPHLVTRVTRDLSAIERQLLRAASLVRAFDAELLAAAVPSARDADVYRFLHRHFVQDNRQGWKTHSVHETLRSSVRTHDRVTPDPWSEREWREAASRVLDHLGTAGGEGEQNREVLVEAFLEGYSLSAEFGLERDWLLKAGHTLCSLGQWTAIRWLTTLDVEPVSPAHGAVLGCLAMYRRTVGNLAEARAYLERALAVATPHSYIHRWLRMERAEVLLRSNQDTEGEAELQSLRTDAVFGERSKVWLALLAQRRGDFKVAMDWALQGIAAGSPQVRHCHGLAGWVLLANGRFDEAEAHFREALAIARTGGSLTQEALALEHLAWCLGWQGSPEAATVADDALELAEKAEYAIGVARSLCTRALSRIGHESPVQIFADLDRARVGIEAAGFRSDVVNPLLVRMAVELVAGDVSAARKTRDDISALTIDVRSHGCDAEVAGWWLDAIAGTGGTTRGPSRSSTVWLDDTETVRDRWIAAVERLAVRVAVEH